MKIFHLSDLHLGKRVHSRSLIEDQKFILEEILEEIKKEKPEAVMIAGDVYDRATPSEEAVELFDDFLYELSALKLNVLIISGNHDSAERLAFGGRIFNRSGIHISPEFSGNITPVTLADEHGEVNFYLLPFVTPAVVRRKYEDDRIESCTDAIRVVVDDMALDTSKRNVLIAHQFVTGAQRTEESETYFVGAAENVDGSVLEPFDYVALGHLHRPQNVGGEKIRYCGTPMKYSFKEAEHVKSITVLELGEKGDVKTREIPLKPKRDWVIKEGKFAELMGEKSDDYVMALLTDEDDVYNAMTRLREPFPNILGMDYKRRKSDFSEELEALGDENITSPEELFAEFYKIQNGGSEMNDRQREIVREIFEELAGGNNDETD